MDETLQRLLDAEMAAERIAQQAEQERDQIIQTALTEARAAEQRFEARIPELHQSFLEKAEARAQQTVNELRRRYEEHHVHLRNLAVEHEEDAIDAAFKLLLTAETRDE